MLSTPRRLSRRRRSRPRHRRSRSLLSLTGAFVLVAALVSALVGSDTEGASGAQTAAASRPAVPPLVTPDVTPSLENPRLLAGQHRHAIAKAAHQERLQRRARAARAARAAERAAARARLAAMDPRDLARSMARQRGWGSGQFACLDSLWQRESGWDRHAQNPSSGAYGIPQALPGSKMASAGSDWRTNPVTQIRWGLQYIAASYGSPCAAWGHSQSHGWY